MDQGALLTWDPYDQPVLGYRLQRSLSPGGGFQPVADLIAAEAYQDAGLENLEQYYYRVQAELSSGTRSSWSAVASVTPHDPGAAGDSVPPNPPQSLEFTLVGSGSDVELLLTWLANVELDLTEYRIYRSEEAGSTASQVGTVNPAVPSDPQSARFQDVEIAEGNAYEYFVRAVDSRGNLSLASDGLIADIQDVTPPLPPTGLEASFDQGLVTLTWQLGLEADLAGYRVYRREFTQGTGGPPVELTSGAIAATTFVDTGAQPDRQYGYAVRAQDEAGNLSDESAEVMVSTAGGTVLWALADARYPVPNDLYFLGSQDATLNLPVPISGIEVASRSALNRQEGWSSIAPISISFNCPLDATTVVLGQTVRVLRVSTASSGGLAGGLVTGVLGELTNFQVEFSEVFEGGQTLRIYPLEPLTPNTTYMVLTTSGIKSDQGLSTTASTDYQYLTNPGTGLDPGDPFAPIQESLLAMRSAAASYGVPLGSLTCSFAFTTQPAETSSNNVVRISLGSEAALVAQMQSAFDLGLSPIDPSAQGWTAPEIPLASWDLGENGFVDTGMNVPGAGIGPEGRLLKGSIDIPYFGDPLGPLNPEGEQPWRARFGWPILDEQGQFVEWSYNLTRFNTVPLVRSVERIPVWIVVGINPLTLEPDLSSTRPATLFIHGAYGNRAGLLDVAPTILAEGRIGIAIDLPLHGLSSGGVSNDPGTPSGSLRERLFGTASSSSLQNFIDLNNLGATSSHLAQAAADLTALRLLAPSFDLDGDGDGEVDPGDLSFFAHSFGAVATTSMLAVHQSQSLPPIPATLAMTTGGLVETLRGSLSLNGRFHAATTLQGAPAGSRHYEEFLVSSQAVLHDVDPMRVASNLLSSSQPIHLVEIAGNGGASLPDTYFPPLVSSAPLAGSGPLRAAMGLQQHSSGTLSGLPVRAYVAFTRGVHYNVTYPLNPFDNDWSFPVFLEILTQAAAFATSAGTSLTITDDSIVQ